MGIESRRIRAQWIAEGLGLLLLLYVLAYGVARTTHVLLRRSVLSGAHHQTWIEAGRGRAGAALLGDLFRPLCSAEVWVHETFPADPPP